MTLLTPYCLAVPIFCYQPYSVTASTLGPIAIELLEDNPAITITGRDHSDFNSNKQIGKTTAVWNRLIPRLRRRGLHVSYFNIQSLTVRKDGDGKIFYLYEPLRKKADTLREADVYVIDELQHVIPFEVAFDTNDTAGLRFVDAMVDLWNRIGEHLDAGGRAVFVTAMHPKHGLLREMVYSAPMTHFLTAPVLELAKS